VVVVTCFVMCVGVCGCVCVVFGAVLVVVTCVLEFTVFRILCTVLYCFVYVHIFVLVLSVLPPSDNSIAFSISISSSSSSSSSSNILIKAGFIF
jgi:hypothetical protein